MLRKILLILLISISYVVYAGDSQPGLLATLLKPNAPLDYTVQSRDTVVGIALKYLTRLGYWPQLLGVRQLSDTQLYPGDKLHLLKVDGRVVLAVDRRSHQQVYEKLSPQVRETSLEQLPPIATKRLQNLLNHPLLMEPAEFESLPAIVAGDNLGALYYSSGDLVYAKGYQGQAGDRVIILSKFRQLTDPDSQESLGYEVQYDGSGIIEQNGPVSSIRLVNTVNQIGDLDRITALPEQLTPTIVPHKPEQIITGKIVALYDALTSTAENNTVVINRGSRDGVDIGQVYDITDSRKIIDPTSNPDEPKYLILPPQVIGEVLIYKVYDKVSFGLITDSSKPILLNAVIQSQQ